jgi:hypothetical protein
VVVEGNGGTNDKSIWEGQISARVVDVTEVLLSQQQQQQKKKHKKRKAAKQQEEAFYGFSGEEDSYDEFEAYRSDPEDAEPELPEGALPVVMGFEMDLPKDKKARAQLDREVASIYRRIVFSKR